MKNVPNRLKIPKQIIGLLILAAFTADCSRKTVLPAIDQNVAGPVDVKYSAANSVFYALNSDFDRSYNSGSILALNNQGQKLAAHTVPRMGRALAVAGRDLLAIFDAEDDKASPQLVLFEIAADGPGLTLVKTWENGSGFSCGERRGSPSNVVMREGYDYFAVSCLNGDLFIGSLKTPRRDSTLHRVRNYTWPRRAMFLDPKRELLFAFVSDNREREATDYVDSDDKSYDPVNGDVVDGPNEVPDSWEETETVRRNKRNLRTQYQFAIYNIAEGREAGFPYDDLDLNGPNKSAEGELHWLYYTLLQKDGKTPDIEAGVTDRTKKAYRTNFWATAPDPDSEDVFYLSQRGKPRPESIFSNNVVKISIVGEDLTALDAKGLPKPSSDLLTFERVYGFSDEIETANHFTGDIAVEMIDGKKLLLVNHFKDLVYFRANPRFSLVAKELGGDWLKEYKVNQPEESIFQLAVDPDGKILTGSFYGNKLIPFTVEPEVDLTLGWGDIKEIR